MKTKTANMPCADCGHKGKKHIGYNLPCNHVGEEGDDPCRCERFRPNSWVTGDIAFKCDFKCPRCKQKRVIAFYYLDQAGAHQHTYYVCTYWPTPKDRSEYTRPGYNAGQDRCGWGDWRGDRGDQHPGAKVGNR